MNKENINGGTLYGKTETSGKEKIMIGLWVPTKKIMNIYILQLDCQAKKI